MWQYIYAGNWHLIGAEAFLFILVISIGLISAGPVGRRQLCRIFSLFR